MCTDSWNTYEHYAFRRKKRIVFRAGRIDNFTQKTPGSVKNYAVPGVFFLQKFFDFGNDIFVSRKPFYGVQFRRGKPARVFVFKERESALNNTARKALH